MNHFRNSSTALHFGRPHLGALRSAALCFVARRSAALRFVAQRSAALRIVARRSAALRHDASVFPLRAAGLLVVAAVLLSNGVPAYSQNLSSGGQEGAAKCSQKRTWSLQDCIAYALEHNITLRQQNIQVLQQEVELRGRFTSMQKDIYRIVCNANELAFSLTRPGITYREVHLATARLMLEQLRDLDLVRGDVDEIVSLGIAGLFQPHGLGHNMGLDVHDMEDLGENLVGYDSNQIRSAQLGLGSLRMARKLVPGNVVTDEPGIYFIPALIDKWKAEGTDRGFVNYAKLEAYRDFGGIRLEDDVLVTEDGARRTGPYRLPILPEDVEEAMGNALS